MECLAGVTFHFSCFTLTAKMSQCQEGSLHSSAMKAWGHLKLLLLQHDRRVIEQLEDEPRCAAKA